MVMMRPRETRLEKPCLCPHCGAKLDASTSIEDPEDVPVPDDVTMCLHCGCILIYTAEMTVRRAELDDLAKLPRDTLLLLMRAQQAQHMAIASRPPKPPEAKH